MLGKFPKLSLVKTDSVRVTTLPQLGNQCYGFVNEGDGEVEFGQQLSYVSNEYCKPYLQQCSYEGRDYGMFVSTACLIVIDYKR